MFQVRCERDRFVLPTRQTDQCADAKPTKTGSVTALGATQPKIEIPFRAGRMHFGIDTPIVSFLIDHESLRARFDDRHIILGFHRPNLD
jgi:hypothetical protein